MRLPCGFLAPPLLALIAAGCTVGRPRDEVSSTTIAKATHAQMSAPVANVFDLEVPDLGTTFHVDVSLMPNNDFASCFGQLDGNPPPKIIEGDATRRNRVWEAEGRLKADPRKTCTVTYYEEYYGSDKECLLDCSGTGVEEIDEIYRKIVRHGREWVEDFKKGTAFERAILLAKLLLVVIVIIALLILGYLAWVFLGG